MSRRLVLGAIAVALIAGCAGPPGAAPTSSFGIDAAAVSSADLTAAGVDVGALSDAWPAPKVSSAEAVTTADAQVASPGDHGPLVTIGRGTAKEYEDPTSPIRTVWVIVYGAGGTVPVSGPAGRSGALTANISMQIVLIDDQTGAFVRGYIKSGP